MTTEQPDKSKTDRPKIIVDDDWKERVQREKEAAKAGPPPQPTPGEDKSQPDATADQEIPPASFPMLVTSLVTQTLAAMGQMPDPQGQQPVVRLDLARHHIDTLSILEQKTQGNLTPDESSMLSSVLHELRMLFVAVQKAS